MTTEIMSIYKVIQDRDEIINNGTKEQIIELAKSYDIFQDRSHSKYYNTTCQRIIDRLTYYDVDVDSLKE